MVSKNILLVEMHTTLYVTIIAFVNKIIKYLFESIDKLLISIKLLQTSFCVTSVFT